MPSPRLLVIEGNTAEGRARQLAAGGAIASKDYAALLGELLPGSFVDICYPADPGEDLPDGAALEGYDGVAVTGSALHVYDGGPAVTAQIELVRAVLASGTPIFGSCWGLQVLTAAAGGSVRKNPRGREVGMGRSIHLTPAGRTHPMYLGKPAVFDAPTVHLDEVETLAPGMTVLATNAATDVQAAEIRTPGGALGWGVQYHPEYALRDIAAIVRRAAKRLIDEGFFTDEAELKRYADELAMLDRDPGNKALSWRLGVDRAMLDKTLRTREIGNWIEHQVLPTRVKRGRG
jgi:GMP synthase (glutamine-hydrolysing)